MGRLKGDRNMFWRALSLRSKLLLLTLAGFVALGVFSIVQIQNSFQSRFSTMKNDYRSRAAGAALDVASAYFDHYWNVQNFATNTVFQSANREAMTQVLNGYIETYKVYDAIVFVDSSGKFIAANSKTFDGRLLETKLMEGRSFAETLWFQKSAKGEFFEDKARGFKGTVVEDLQIDPLSTAFTGSPQYGMSFSRPVFAADGHLQGVLTARASLRYIENQLKDVFDLMKLSGYNTSQVMMLNREGLLLAEISQDLLAESGEIKRNSDKIMRWNVATQQGQIAAQDVVVGRSGAIVETDRLSRIDRLWGFQPLKDARFPEQLGWSVVISAATDEVFHDLIAQRRVFYAGFVFLFSLVGLFGYGFAQRLDREFLEYSSRIRDESERLVELGDGLGNVLQKAMHADQGQHSKVDLASESGKDLFAKTDDFEKSLELSVHNALSLHEKANQSEKSVRQLTEQIAIASTSAEQLANVDALLKDVSQKMTLINESIFKAQLLGFNASIEAARAGSHGKGFAHVAGELEGLAQVAGNASRGLLECLAKTQSEMNLIGSAIKKSVAEGETLIGGTLETVKSFESEFERFAESIESMRLALLQRDEDIKKVFAAVNTLDDTTSRNQFVFSELKRGVQEMRNQSYQFDELMNDMTQMIKGQRVRQRARRGGEAESSMFSMGAEISPDKMRADAVDRLAQKMRPRLVVKTEDHEPEVTELGVEENQSRRVG
ncbi:hypothetical protein EBU99_08080 [bacterium]|nr:hypothetical protein [bacterium]